jgi:hypothetical protein
MFSAENWGEEQKFVLATFWAPEHEALKFWKRLNFDFFCTQHRKLEAKGKKFAQPPIFDAKSWRLNIKKLFGLFWNSQAWSFEGPNIFSNLFVQCKFWFLFNLIVYLFILQNTVKTWSPSKEVFWILFSHSLFKLCILLFVSFYFVLQVPPSQKGVEFIEWKLLEEISEKVFSLFQLFMILLFCKFLVFFKLILCPLVLKYRALIHNQVETWMSMNFNMRWKPPLHPYILSNVSFVIFHIVPF